MPANSIATIALLSYAPASLAAFRLLRPVEAAGGVLLGCGLLLPARYAYDLPGIPALDRHLVGSLGTLVGYFLLVKSRSKRSRGFGWPEILILVQTFATLITMLLNGDPLFYGPRALPGLHMSDSLGLSAIRFLLVGVPFLLGARLVRDYKDAFSVIRVVLFFGLLYVPIIIWEVRMSPQLHTQLYGYFPVNFGQHVRGGGFRPMGFTIHGLELALFVSTAAIAGVGMARARLEVFKIPGNVLALVLIFVLVLCKSFAALLYGVLGCGLLYFVRPRLVALVVTVLAAIVITYPLLRAQDFFPTTAVVELAAEFSEDRSLSLDYRFWNEDILLAKARERIFFGWGTHSRNRVFDERRGRDLSTTDGFWIIEIGKYGLAGFLSYFGLALIPIVLAARKIRSIPAGPAQYIVLSMMLMLLVRTIDLIPNGFPSVFTMFLAGALTQFGTNPPGARKRGPHRRRKRPLEHEAVSEVSPSGGLSQLLRPDRSPSP